MLKGIFKKKNKKYMNNKMVISTYISKIALKMNKQNRNRSRYREHFHGCQMGGQLRGWVQKAKELRSTNWLLRNSHGDV